MKRKDLTLFQKTLPNDLDTCWEIVKIFHPNIPEFTTNNKGQKISVRDHLLKAYGGNYDRVSIEFRVRGYGYIHICINNCHDTSFMFGPSVTKERMQNALDNNKVQFRAWRIVTDETYKKCFENLRYDSTIRKHIEQLEYNLYSQLLTEKGYKLQSVNEWYNNYYTD
jgi:hypothetical protein